MASRDKPVWSGLTARPGGIGRALRRRLPASKRQMDDSRRDAALEFQGVVGSQVQQLTARFDAFERRIAQVQELTARVYEAQLDWRSRLEYLRQEPEYEKAYTGEPLVSVRIATFNKAEELCERCLSSVRRQTYENWEALVVGDALDDDTERRIKALGDSRIRFWNLPSKAPTPKTEGLAGKWLVLLR